MLICILLEDKWDGSLIISWLLKRFFSPVFNCGVWNVTCFLISVGVCSTPWKPTSMSKACPGHAARSSLSLGSSAQLLLSLYMWSRCKLHELPKPSLLLFSRCWYFSLWLLIYTYRLLHVAWFYMILVVHFALNNQVGYSFLGMANSNFPWSLYFLWVLFKVEALFLSPMKSSFSHAFSNTPSQTHDLFFHIFFIYKTHWVQLM